MKSLRLTIGVGLVLASGIGSSSGARAESLREADVVRIALAKNPRVAEQEQNVLGRQAALRAQTSELLPTASLGTTVTRNDAAVTTTTADWNSTPIALRELTVRARDTSTFTFDLSQPLFRGGSLLANRKSAALDRDAARADLSATRGEVELLAREAFYDLALAQERVRIAEENLDQLRESYRVANRRFEVGAAPKSDQLRAEASVAEGEQALVKAESDVEVARAALNSIMLRPLDSAATAVVDDSLPQSELALPSYLELATRNRPELQALALRVGSAQSARRSAAGSLLPNLSMQFHYQRDSSPGAFSGGQDSWYIAGVARFDWPLGMGRVARVAEARAHERALAFARDANEQSILLEVEAAHAAVVVARKGIELSDRRRAAAEESFRQVEVRYRNGDAAQVDFLDAQARLTSAKVSQIEERLGLRRAVARLERAVGNSAHA
ncbi:MAG: TolC family protein [Candidatus Eisenbacteria bacterium]